MMNTDPDVVPDQSPIVLLDSKPAVCISTNGKDIKHTRQNSRRIHFVRNGWEWNLHDKVWREGVIKLVDIRNNNLR